MVTTLLNRAQVLERLGNRSVTWLYEAMRSERFPRPIRLGPNSVAWVESEVSDYITNRINQDRVVLAAKPRRKPTIARAPDQAA